MASDLGSDLEEDSVLEASLMEWASKFKPKGEGDQELKEDVDEKSESSVEKKLTKSEQVEALINAWPTQSSQLLLERPASCHAGLRTLPAQGQVAPREACIRKACDHLTRLQLVLERVILDQIAAASQSSDSSASKPTIPSASELVSRKGSSVRFSAHLADRQGRETAAAKLVQAHSSSASMAADADEVAAPAKRILNPLLQRLPHLLVQNDKSATPSESRVSKRPSEQNGALSVVGVGLDSNQITPASRAPPRTPLTSDQTRRVRRALAAWQVVEEVLALVAAMERDLKHNAHLLDEERERIENMNGRLEQLAEMRLNELPEAVQREHESCIRDLTELQWHLNFKARVEQRHKRRLQQAEEQLRRLRAEIQHMRMSKPFVEEKLQVLANETDVIDSDTGQRKEELSGTLVSLGTVESKNTDAHQKADAERAVMKRDLLTVNSHLRSVTNELELAETHYHEFCERIAAAHEKLKSNEESRRLLEAHARTAADEEINAKKRVRALKERIEVAVAEHDQLRLMLHRSKTEHDGLQSKLSSTRKQLEQEFEQKQRELLRLLDALGELTLDCDDLVNKLADVEARSAQCEQQSAKFSTDIDKVERQILMSEEEREQIDASLVEAQRVFQAEERRAREAEQKLKESIDAIKGQIEEEIHNRTVIKSRINTEAADLKAAREQFKKKQEASKKLLAEVQRAIQSSEQKAVKWRAIHADKAAILAAALADLRAATEAFEAMRAELQGGLDTARPQIESHKSELARLAHVMAELQWQDTALEKKEDDLSGQLKAITKSATTIQAILEKLDLEVKGVLNEYYAQVRKQDYFKKSIELLRERTLKEAEENAALVEARTHELNDLKTTLERTMEYNARVAARYRRLHNCALLLKERVQELLGDKLAREVQLSDTHELHLLQVRMREAQRVYQRYLLQLGEAKAADICETSADCSLRAQCVQQTLGETCTRVDLMTEPAPTEKPPQDADASGAVERTRSSLRATPADGAALERETPLSVLSRELTRSRTEPTPLFATAIPEEPTAFDSIESESRV